MCTVAMLGELFHSGITQLLAAAFLLVITLYMVYGRGKRYNLPPGLMPLPIIGNILLFMRSSKQPHEVMVDLSKIYGPICSFRFVFMRSSKQPHEVMVDLSKIYGPICSFRFGMMKAVVLNNIELVKEALVKIPNDFAGRPKTFTGDLVTEGGKDIVFADFGPTWRLHRKIAYKAIRTYITGPQLETKVHASLTKAFELMEKENGPYDPKEYISLMIYNFISGFCYGQSYETDDPEFKKLSGLSDTFLEEASNGLPEDYIPFLKYFPMPKTRRLLIVFNEFLGILRKKFHDHQDTYNASEMRDFVDCLIKAKKEAQEEEDEALLAQLTDTHLVQTLADIFGAGTDTSRFTIYWAVLFMAKYPEIQKKVYEEIMASVGKDRLPSITDKPNLCYTEATLYECMRVGTVAPTGVPHCTMVDSKIGEFDIPKGTTVLVNHWALHNDPNYWTDPETFQPERFLEKEGNMAPKPESFLPFSAGRRVCLGESVAKPELLLFFAAIMQKFEISAPSGVTLSLSSMGGATGCIPKPYKILTKPRV